MLEASPSHHLVASVQAATSSPAGVAPATSPSGADTTLSRPLRRRGKRDALRPTSPAVTDSAVVTSAGYTSEASENAADEPMDALDLLIERSTAALDAARACLSTTIDTREALRRLHALDDTLDRSITRFEQAMRTSITSPVRRDTSCQADLTARARRRRLRADKDARSTYARAEAIADNEPVGSGAADVDVRAALGARDACGGRSA